MGQARFPAAMFVTAEVVRPSDDPVQGPLDRERRRREVVTVASTIQSTLRLDRVRRTAMFEQMARIHREHTPRTHMHLLDRALDTGVRRKVARFRSAVASGRQLSSDEHLFLETHSHVQTSAEDLRVDDPGGGRRLRGTSGLARQGPDVAETDLSDATGPARAGVAPNGTTTVVRLGTMAR